MTFKQLPSAVAFILALVMLVRIGLVHAGALPEFTSLVTDNSPAVVNISVAHKAEAGPAMLSPDTMPHIPDDGPLGDLLKRFFKEMPRSDPPEHPSRGVGSGFVISNDGYVLTNAHVVKGADEINVRLSDNRELSAKLVGLDERTDIALLKMSANELPFVKIGNSEKLKVGEWVLAIGSPFGLEHTATQGIVSALGRSLPSETYVPFIQTDVAVNPGNSGGPLFNTSGEVIGVNSQIFSKTGGYMGLSFAIPINVAMDVVEQLKTTGTVSRGWLGVMIQTVTHELAQSFNMERAQGALIAEVTAKSPADLAGLKQGDVILEFNGIAVNDSSQLPALVGVTKAGSSVDVKILRNGKNQDVTVQIQALDEEGKVAVAEDASSTGKLDMSVADLTPEQREQFGIGDHGVLVKDVQNGPAEKAGIRSGDILLSINNEAVTNVEDLMNKLNNIEKGSIVPILVQRENSPLFLALTVPTA